MAYVGRDGRELNAAHPRLDDAPGLACGGSCGCRACATRRLGESYIPDDGDDDDESDREPDDQDDDESRGPRRRARRRSARARVPRLRRGRVMRGRLGAIPLGAFALGRPRVVFPPGVTVVPCPAPADVARTVAEGGRCQTRRTCDAIPGLMCYSGIGPVRFEYRLELGTDPATSLKVVTRRDRRPARFTADVGRRLDRFIGLMRQFGLPIEAILTIGTHYCRCISNKATLSEHATGTAIDVAGVRWAEPVPLGASLRETIVDNFEHDGERRLLRRINACLRLSFPLVIDYNYNRAHQNHFHCDLHGGSRTRSLSRTTALFAQEILGVFGRPVRSSGEFDRETLAAVAAASGVPEATGDRTALNQALDRLFTMVARGMQPPVPTARNVAPRPSTNGASPESAGGRAGETEMVQELVRRGNQDVNKVTSAVFFRRHPERRGQRIAAGERAAAAEWIRIRDTLVRPVLAAEAGQ